MDTKYSCHIIFKAEIARFFDGQMQFRTAFGETYRCKPLSIGFDGCMHPRRFFIWFEWFVKVRPVFSSTNGLPFLVGDKNQIFRRYSISFDLDQFYFPKSPFFRKGDRRRMKWRSTTHNEEFRFFMGDDIARMEFDAEGDLVSKSSITIKNFDLGVPTTIQPP